MTRNAVFHAAGVFDDGAGTLDIPAASGLTAHLADSSDAHDASAISFSPTGTIAATDVQAAIAEVATEAAASGATEYDYVQQTSTLAVTATSDATAQAFISGNAVTYDGSTRILVECWAPFMDITGNQAVVLNLYDGSTDLGRIANLQTVNASGLTSETVSGKRFLTPTAAAHTYHIKAWKTGGTASVGAGAGGTATYLPAFMRITSA